MNDEQAHSIVEQLAERYSKMLGKDETERVDKDTKYIFSLLNSEIKEAVMFGIFFIPIVGIEKVLLSTFLLGAMLYKHHAEDEEEKKTLSAFFEQ